MRTVSVLQKRFLSTLFVAAALCGGGAARAIEIGQEAPPIEADHWIGGEIVSSWEAVRGKVVVLLFASAQNPESIILCKALHDALRDRAPKGMLAAVVAGAPSARARSVLDKAKVKLPLAVDDGSIASAFHAAALPYGVVVNRDGRISYADRVVNKNLFQDAMDDAVRAPLSVSELETTERFRPVWRAIGGQRWHEGIALLQAILDGDRTDKERLHAEGLLMRIALTAEPGLEQARRQIAAGDDAGLVTCLEVADTFAGTSAEQEARAILAGAKKNPKLKKAFKALDLYQKALAQLVEGERQKAIRTLKKVTRTYKKTALASLAERKLSEVTGS